MGITHRTGLALAMAGAVLAGCGDKAGKPQGEGLKAQDVSRVTSPVAGQKLDSRTLETRRVAGTWTGTSPMGEVELSLGNDGSASVTVMKDGGLVDSSHGSYTLKEDGTLSGSLSTSGRALDGFHVWNAAFPSPGVMSIAGSGGAAVTVSKRGGVDMSVVKVPAGGVVMPHRVGDPM